MINIATPSVTYMRNRLPAELRHHVHFAYICGIRKNTNAISM
ncbi:unknown [Prevotella sp. CAG:487]|nr:unknown [Prevotella sp. CAG:487]